MKTCTKCKQEKPFDFYHKGNAKGGYRTWCKACVAEYKKQYKITNADKIKQVQQAYDTVQNPLRKQYFQQRYVKNKQHILSVNSAYIKANPHKNACKEAKRRTAKLQRTPNWLIQDDYWMIEQAYELAALRTKMFGFSWHVDHIIPLQGKKVSGLHVPHNLQVIPAKVNLSKHNNFEVVF